MGLSDARLRGRIGEEDGRSLRTLVPFKDKLARTDGLIGRVVYRLYGLTEEEIAVVEGRAATAGHRQGEIQ